MKQCPICKRKIEVRRSVALQEDVLQYHHDGAVECEASRVAVSTAGRLARARKEKETQCA